MKVLDKPLSRAEIIESKRRNPTGYTTVVIAVGLPDVVAGMGEEDFYDLLCQGIIGQPIGIEDLNWEVVGHLGLTLYLKCSGCIDLDALDAKQEAGK